MYDGNTERSCASRKQGLCQWYFGATAAMNQVDDKKAVLQVRMREVTNREYRSERGLGEL